MLDLEKHQGKQMTSKEGGETSEEILTLASPGNPALIEPISKVSMRCQREIQFEEVSCPSRKHFLEERRSDWKKESDSMRKERRPISEHFCIENLNTFRVQNKILRLQLNQRKLFMWQKAILTRLSTSDIWCRIEKTCWVQSSAAGVRTTHCRPTAFSFLLCMYTYTCIGKCFWNIHVVVVP